MGVVVDELLLLLAPSPLRGGKLDPERSMAGEL